jgi:hypothetical protein
MPPGARSKETPQSQSQQSKEATPMPETLPDSQSTKNLGASNTSNYQDTRNLAESFNLLTRYGDEFMDENPLVGEPGSFILSRAGDTGKPAPKFPAPAAGSTPLPIVSTPQVRVETPGRSEKSPPPSGGLDKGKKKKRVVS